MSREIDALIAEHVMGWKQVETGPYSYQWEDDLGQYWDITEKGPFPHYSTDIAAAWEVYMKIFNVHKTKHNNGDILIVGVNPYVNYRIQRTKYPFITGYMNYDCIDIYSEADTPAMAICLAALKSKGVEVE